MALGADKHAKAADGRTPLHRAALNGHVETAKALEVDEEAIAHAERMVAALMEVEEEAIENAEAMAALIDVEEEEDRNEIRRRAAQVAAAAAAAAVAPQAKGKGKGKGKGKAKAGAGGGPSNPCAERLKRAAHPKCPLCRGEVQQTVKVFT